MNTKIVKLIKENLEESFNLAKYNDIQITVDTRSEEHTSELQSH